MLTLSSSLILCIIGTNGGIFRPPAHVWIVFDLQFPFIAILNITPVFLPFKTLEATYLPDTTSGQYRVTSHGVAQWDLIDAFRDSWKFWYLPETAPHVCVIGLSSYISMIYVSFTVWKCNQIFTFIYTCVLWSLDKVRSFCNWNGREVDDVTRPAVFFSQTDKRLPAAGNRHFCSALRERGKFCCSYENVIIPFIKQFIANLD